MRNIVLLALLLVSTAVGACNQGGGPTGPAPVSPAPTPVPAPPPTPGPSPAPPTQPAPAPAPPVQPFTQTITGFVGPYKDVSHPFTTPRAGTATFTIRWTDPSVDLDVVLTETPCAYLYSAPCVITDSSMGLAGTSDSFERQVQAGEQFWLWASNFSHTLGQSYTIEIDIR